jgi:hypothetical protein
LTGSRRWRARSILTHSSKRWLPIPQT